MDGKSLSHFEADSAHSVNRLEIRDELGWSERSLELRLKGPYGLTCNRARLVSNSLHEFRGKQYLINGEPFLIKGVIPNFSAPSINLSLEQGLSQIKTLGANAVRLYHHPSDEFYQKASRLGLLLVDQPDESTWENVKLSSESDTLRLFKDYEKLQNHFKGNSFILFHSMGNELEALTNREVAFQTLDALLTKAKQAPHETPISYSTYLTFVNYPVDVLGINMLDAGPLYWKEALAVTSSFGRPFYASEFGGFVAQYEKTPTRLRILRMQEQWEELQKIGALGGMFFESHDNWAQPVVEGYNDPSQPEQPDDLRGIWDDKNKPKPELIALQTMYSDLKIQTEADHWLITNVRDYRLEKINLNLEGATPLEIGNLAPRASLRIAIPPELMKAKALMATYSTHHGLPGYSRVSLENELNAPLGMNSIQDFHWSRDGVHWFDLMSDQAIEGKTFVRFKVSPEILRSKTTLLVWAGLGSSEVTIGGKRFQCHAYRDCLIPPSDLTPNPDGYVYGTLSRDSLIYLNRQDHPAGEVKIKLEKPQLFELESHL
jgi:hypothetical protein